MSYDKIVIIQSLYNTLYNTPHYNTDMDISHIVAPNFLSWNLTSFVDHLCYFCLVLLCILARLFVDALWSPAGKGLTSWLSFVMSNRDLTFPLVPWVVLDCIDS